MAELVWSPRAIRDINEIAEFISKDSIQYAKAQARQFIEEAKILERYPHKGRMVPEIGDSNIRQILCGHYRIIYEVADRKVGILTVHHQARLLKNNPAMKRRLRKK